MACPCCGTYNRNTVSLAELLQMARIRLGVKLPVNSAYRCPFHNKKVGGVPRSYHLRGLAVDISTIHLDSFEIEALIQILRDLGFRGFIVYPNFLHADLRKYGYFYSHK